MKHPCWHSAFLLSVPLVSAEPVVEHRPAGCMVAGKYPRLKNACFAALSHGRTGARVLRAGRRELVITSDEVRTHRATRACLPRPAGAVGRTSRYVEAADAGSLRRRTEDSARWWSRKCRLQGEGRRCRCCSQCGGPGVPVAPCRLRRWRLGLGATAASSAVMAARRCGRGGPARGRRSVAGHTPTTSPPGTFPHHHHHHHHDARRLLPVFKSSRPALPSIRTPRSRAGPSRVTFDMCESVGPYKLSFAVEVRRRDSSSRDAARRSRSRLRERRRAAGRSLARSRHVANLRRVDEDAVGRHQHDPQAAKRVSVQVNAIHVERLRDGQAGGPLSP